MSKKPELLECQGGMKAGSGYLLEYQKAVLLALQREGLLDQAQLNECVAKLEHDFPKEEVP